MLDENISLIHTAVNPASRRLFLGLALAALVLTLGFWWKSQGIDNPSFDQWRVESTSRMTYSDIISIYYERDLATHPLPYAEMRMEYPPILGAIIYLTSFAPGPQGYFLANYLLLALAGLGVVWMIYLLNPRAQLWIFAATPPLFLYAGLNWDLLAVFATLAALVLFQHGHDRWSAIALAVGAWTKLFPGLLLPLLLLRRSREGNRQGMVEFFVTFFLVSLLVNLSVFILSPWGWLETYVFHGGRGADEGSLWFWMNGFPLVLIDVICGAALIGVMFATYGPGLRKGRSLAEIAMVILILFVLVNKVSSPQYHLWLMPFLALYPPPAWLLGSFLAADLAYFLGCFESLFAFWHGRGFFTDLMVGLREPIDIFRVVVLAALFVWAARRLARQPSRLIK